MLDTYCRSHFENWLVGPVIKLLKALRISPHLLTALACLLGLCVIPVLAMKSVWLSIVLTLASGYLDILDGSLARSYLLDTPKGCVFDIVSDRIVEFAILLGLYLYDPPSRGLPCMLMLGSSLICVTSFLVVSMFQNNPTPPSSRIKKSFQYSPGLMERTEAFLFFLLMIALPDIFNILAFSYSALVGTTAMIRIRQFVKSTLTPS